MIIGAHSIIYSKKPQADRAFLRDVLGLPNVDVGDGWLIFGLPPAEVAVHPSSKNDLHEFYLMCDDAEAFCASMRARGVTCQPLMDLGWGVLTGIMLPGGGRLGVYEPRHARPKSMKSPKTPKAIGTRKRVTVRVRRTKKRSTKKIVRKTTVNARRKTRGARA